MPLLTRLSAAVSAVFGPRDAGTDVEAPADLAVVALLAHVARVDGRVDERERAWLTRLMGDRFGLGATEAAALFERASALDDEVRDLADLADMAARDADETQRRRILEMAWSVAGADGTVHEFEDALVTRLGQLLRLSEGAMEAARASADLGVGPAGPKGPKG